MRGQSLSLLGLLVSVLLLAALALAGWSQVPLSSGDDAVVASVKALPSLSSSLAQYYLDWQATAGTRAALTARHPGLEVASDAAVRVWVMQAPGLSTDSIDLGALARLGGRVAGLSEHFLEAWIPPAALPLVAEQVPGVVFLREPIHLDLATVSEGVSLTGADALHDLGLLGAGAKVAVIDLEFGGLTSAIGRGEVPSSIIQVNYSGSGMESGGVHGTACAEIVYDMAPGAQLYAILIGQGAADLENAIAYCIDQGIAIASCSWGSVDANFQDGTGALCDLFNYLYASGVLPIVAAGNAADGHSEGTTSDPDGNLWHNFSGTDEDLGFTATKGQPVSVVLSWAGWPTTSQDYDLYIKNSGGTTVASSLTRQNGSQPGLEELVFTPGSTGTFQLKIKRYSLSVSTGLRYDIYIGGADSIDYLVRGSSLTSPADSADAVAVGAIAYYSWTTGPQETFSSQGPTNDGRLKPELCGPDGVTSSTYGGHFYGTSAATPHVAGAAALLKSVYPAWTIAQLRDELLQTATDMGTSGPDNVYGHGRLTLEVAHAVSVTSATANPTTIVGGGTTQLSAAATDTQGHAISWSWTDNGASGTFAPSRFVAGPTWTGPGNTTGAPITRHLTVTATCNGTSPLSGNRTVDVTENMTPHAVEVTVSALPMTVPPGGTTQLTGSAVDTSGHGLASYSWSDGGAGGAFSPSAAVASPTYTAPGNETGAPVSRVLTLTVTCSGVPSTSGSSSVTVTENAHAIQVTASANPTTVESGGSTGLSATVVDTAGHGVASYSWSDGGAGGSFLPNNVVRDPVYVAPGNPIPVPMYRVLTVTVHCDGSPSLVGTDTVTITENGLHSLTITASAARTSIPSQGTAQFTASAFDPFGHPIVLWAWDDGGAGGAFLPNAAVQNPTYVAPLRTTLPDLNVTLNVTAACSTGAVGTGFVPVTVYAYEDFTDVPLSFWAFSQIEACFHAGIASGYKDGTFQPAWTVSRAQMAVFLTRGLNGGTIPVYTGTPSFTDVAPGEFGYDAIEYVAAQKVAMGYANGMYGPGVAVNRGQMAAFLARSMVDISERPDLPGYTPPATPTFPDVATTFTFYRYIEYIADPARSITGGFKDGDYHPELACTRAQMAVFLTKAFAIPL